MSQTTVVLSGLVIQVLAARFLGAAGFGMYAYILNLSAMLSFLADPNLQVWLTREVSRSPGEAGVFLGRSLGLWAALSGVLVLAGLVVTSLTDGRPEVMAAVLVAGVGTSLFAAQTLFEGVFQGLRRMGSMVWANLASRSLYLAGAVVVLVAYQGLVGLFLVQAISFLAAIAWLVFRLLPIIGGIRWPSAMDVVRLGRDVVPFGVSRFFGTVYLTGDVFFLQLFVSDADLGRYRMASLLLVQLGAIAVMLNRVFLPWFSARTGDPLDFNRSLDFAIRIALLVSVPLGVGGALVAEPLIAWIGGEEYRAAWPVMAVLMLVAPTRFLNTALGTALSAIDRQIDRAWGTVFGAVALTLGAVIVASRYGILGVACLVLVVDVLVLIYQGSRLRAGLDLLRSSVWLGRLVVGLAAMVALVVGLSATPVWVQISLGGAGFVVAAYAAGAWSLADVRQLMRL